jgi:hypothetical protein
MVLTDEGSFNLTFADQFRVSAWNRTEHMGPGADKVRRRACYILGTI